MSIVLNAWVLTRHRPLSLSLSLSQHLTRHFHLTERRMDIEFMQKSVLISVWNFMQTISQEDEGRSLSLHFI
jgi:hypothetical protein